MLQELAHALKAQPYQRTEARTGHANGFKDKTLTTRLGPIKLEVPQVRGELDWYY
jgi:putative transposase